LAKASSKQGFSSSDDHTADLAFHAVDENGRLGIALQGSTNVAKQLVDPLNVVPAHTATK
jgi:hypothetical protein